MLFKDGASLGVHGLKLLRAYGISLRRLKDLLQSFLSFAKITAKPSKTTLTYVQGFVAGVAITSRGPSTPLFPPPNSKPKVL